MPCSGAIKKVNRTLRILEKGTGNKQNNNPLSLHDHIVTVMCCSDSFLLQENRSRIHIYIKARAVKALCSLLYGGYRVQNVFIFEKQAQKGACVFSCVYSHEWHVAVNRDSYSLFLTKQVKVN